MGERALDDRDREPVAARRRVAGVQYAADLATIRDDLRIGDELGVGAQQHGAPLRGPAPADQRARARELAIVADAPLQLQLDRRDPGRGVAPRVPEEVLELCGLERLERDLGELEPPAHRRDLVAELA